VVPSRAVFARASLNVLWRRVFSSYKGYLNWLPRAFGVEKLECQGFDGQGVET
jgi:hypothetical protein